MSDSKETYARSLKKGTLSKGAKKQILKLISAQGMEVEKFPAVILKQTGYRPKIEFFVCRGNRSWEGLIAAFPGTKEELSTRNVGTPFLRKTLYPTLVLHRELRLFYSRQMPCIYLIGDHFNDVFLRKFRFLSSLAPNVIVLSGDLGRWVNRKQGHWPTEKPTALNEYYLQKSLCDQMRSEGGLLLPSKTGEDIQTGLISYEVPTVSSSVKSERMDILGYDINDHSYVVYEIKGPNPSRPELENLFFQGLEHRNWLEENKRAVKFACEGPRGRKINTRKRVKLVLGFCGDKVPELFFDLRTQAYRKDRFLKIDFVRLVPPKKFGGKVKVESFEE